MIENMLILPYVVEFAVHFNFFGRGVLAVFHPFLVRVYFGYQTVSCFNPENNDIDKLPGVSSGDNYRAKSRRCKLDALEGLKIWLRVGVKN